jgi:hypothetical protein
VDVDLDYVGEKTGVAMELLACREGSLRQRLYNAFMSFHVVNPDELPEDMGTALRSIRERFYRIGPQEATNNIRASLEGLTLEEAQNLAYDIFELYEQVAIARAKEEDF